MLASYIPYITYASAALAGLVFIAPVIEVGKKQALLSFFVAAALSLLFAEPYSKALFVCFLGYYPILKAVLDKIRSNILCLIIKLMVFNAAAVLTFFTAAYILMVPLDFLDASIYYIAGMALVANIVFLLYDYGVGGVARFYMARLHGPVSSILKGRR